MKKENPDYRLVPHDGHHLRIELLRGCFTEDEASRIPGCYFNHESNSWLLPFRKPVPGTGAQNNRINGGKRASRRKILFMEMDSRKKLVRLRFPGGDRLEKWLRENHPCRWDPVEKAWEVKGGKDFMKAVVSSFGRGDYDIRIAVKGVQKYKNGQRKPVGESALCPSSFYRHLTEKGYSQGSIQSYTSHINRFLNHINGYSPAELGVEQLGEYIVEQVAENAYSPATQNQLINALVLFYETEYGESLDTGCLPRPYRSRQQPRVLTRQEVDRILDVTPNLKHRTLLALIYGTGMRLSEAASLRLTDVDFVKGRLVVRETGGKQNRAIPIPRSLLGDLRRYLEEYRPVRYLFEGRQGKPYSGRSIQHILKRSLVRSGIGWEVHVHTLRHSFATHQLQNGTGLGQVQHLLGHRSSRTTEVYSALAHAGQSTIQTPVDHRKWK